MPGGPPGVTAWQEALFEHLQRLTDAVEQSGRGLEVGAAAQRDLAAVLRAVMGAVERVEGRLVGLEAALVKRGSL